MTQVSDTTEGFVEIATGRDNRVNNYLESVEVSSSPTLDTNGPDNQPGNAVVIRLTGESDIQQISKGSSVLGRQIIVVNTSLDALTLKHNAANGDNNRPFILAGSTDVELTPLSSLTFWCDGQRWIELSRSIK